MSRLFSIVGDSNVRRNMTGLNIASREAMKSAQVIDCELISSLEAALAEVRAESNICIVAAITVFLLSPGDCGTVSSTIDPVLDSFSRRLTQFCTSRQDLQVGASHFSKKPYSNFYCSSGALPFITTIMD